MKLLLLQTDIKWQDPEFNRNHAAELIETAGRADLVVLPEMFTTGFCTSPAGAAEPVGSETLPWMQRTAKKYNAALCGSVATEERGRYFNRFYFVKPDGSYQAYDKRHLFSYAGEDKEYTAGRERVIVEQCGLRILLQVCYDLRFPVFSRNEGDYDLILYVANWPTSRLGAWNTLLKARAIENQCYVAGINRTGADPACRYSGGTALIDYLGNPIAEARAGAEEGVSGEINKELLTDFRQKFPALRDADRFAITI